MQKTHHLFRKHSRGPCKLKTASSSQGPGLRVSVHCLGSRRAKDRHVPGFLTAASWECPFPGAWQVSSVLCIHSPPEVFCRPLPLLSDKATHQQRHAAWTQGNWTSPRKWKHWQDRGEVLGSTAAQEGATGAMGMTAEDQPYMHSPIKYIINLFSDVCSQA